MVCRLLGSPTSANQWDAERKLGFNTCKSHLQLLVHGRCGWLVMMVEHHEPFTAAMYEQLGTLARARPRHEPAKLPCNQSYHIIGARATLLSKQCSRGRSTLARILRA